MKEWGMMSAEGMPKDRLIGDSVLLFDDSLEFI